MAESVYFSLLQSFAEAVVKFDYFKNIKIAFNASYDSTERSEEVLYVVPGNTSYEQAARDGLKRTTTVNAVLVKSLITADDMNELDALTAKLETAANLLASCARLNSGGFVWSVENVEIDPGDPTQLEQNLIFNGRIAVDFKAVKPIR